MQADLKSDDWCSYNSSSAPIEWILQKGQYNNTFAIGSVGVPAGRNYVRADVVNIDSYLSGRNDILSKCNPPIPALDDANETPLRYQDEKNTNYLQPIYSREKGAAINLAAISYIPYTFEPDLPNPPQILSQIIFNEPQRGGINTSNMLKNAWNSDSFEYFLDPNRACGAECSEANGYMTRLPYTEQNPEATWGKLPSGLPNSSWVRNPNQTNTQVGKYTEQPQITSEYLVSIGAQRSGPQQALYDDKIPYQKGVVAEPPQLANPFTGKRYLSNPLKWLFPS